MSLGIPSPAGLDQIQALTSAMRAAPELQQSPGAAVVVSQTPDPAGNAQAVGLGLQSQAAQQAAQQFQQTAGHPPKHHKGLLGDIGGAIGDVAHDIGNDVMKPLQRDVLSKHIPGTPTQGSFLGIHANQVNTVGAVASNAPTGALQLANMPLQEVQHNYRYIHDVWQRHGPIPALAELAGIVGAGVTAGYLTKSAKVGILAGEAAGYAEGQAFYRDSWQRTANGSAYRDSSGQLVSPGRDVANLLGVNHTGAAHGIISGGMDALFDVMTDPLAQVGGLYGEAKGPEGAIVNPATGRKLFVGTALRNPGDADALYHTLGLQPSAIQFRRAVGFMADHTAAEIAQRFPEVTQVPGLAARLGAASTDEGVLNVLEDRLAFEKAMNEGRFTPLRILNPLTGTSTEMTRPAYNPITGELVSSEQTKSAFAGGAPTMSSFEAVTKGAIQRLENRAGAQRLRSLEILPDNLRIPVVGDEGVQNLRRLALQGMPPRVANDLIDQFLSTNDIEARGRIIKAISEATVLGRAGIDPSELDAGLLQKVRARIDEVFGGERPEGEYGINDKGDNLSKITVTDPDGSVKATAGAAIWKGQTSDTRGILGYGDVKDLSQAIRGYRSIFGWPGKVDDFMWDHFTDTWRKLALLTGSFAMHIAAAEQLLNTSRLGLVPMVNGAMAKLADLGYQVNEGDAGPIRSLVYHLLGSPTAAPDAADVDLATHIAVATGGHGVTPQTSAGWVFPTTGESPVETARTAMDGGHVQLAKGEMVGSNYKLYRGDDKNVKVWWGQHLNQIAEDPTGRAAAQAFGAALTAGLSPEQASARALDAVQREMAKWTPIERQLYMRSTQTSIDGVDPMTAFARTKVESMKGAVTGADGKLNEDLIAKIANGDTMNWRDVADKTPKQTPWNVPGREIIPNPDGRIDRLAQLGHEKVLTPFINFFSRQPTYFAETSKAYEAYKPLVESGLIDKPQAMDWAMQDANKSMLRFIHNPQERLQATETFRNVAPFAFAQVQAYKRFGRLLLDDPGAFRKMQMVLTGMTDLANRAKDPNGIQQAVYPGSGYVTHGMLAAASLLGMPVTSAVPVNFAGSTSALQAVDPFMQGVSGVRPSMGLLVSVAAHLIDGLDPRASQIVSAIVGSQTANESMAGLIPNTPLRHLIEGAPYLTALFRSNDTIWMHTLANLDYAQNQAMTKWEQTQQYKDWVANGGDPNDPNAPGRPNIVPSPEAPAPVRQAFVDSVRSQGRWVHIVQALMSEVTPASPQALIGNQKIPAEFRNLVAKEGYAKGSFDFLQAHPDVGPLIQSMSSATGGGVLNETAKTMDWVHQHQDFVNGNKDIASFFVPQMGDPYSAAAYNEQVAIGLRQLKTPQQFQDDFYINTAMADYDANRQAYEQALQQSGAQQIYPGDATHPATYSSTGQSQLNAAWDQWLATFKAQNPTWAEWFDSPNTQIEARQGYNHLVEVLNSGTAPSGPQTDVLKNMVDQYRNYVSALTPGANGVLSQTSSVNRPITDAWQDWLKSTAADHPEYAPVINKIFRWLVPLSQQG